jgi:hypothetical protein
MPFLLSKIFEKYLCYPLADTHVGMPIPSFPAIQKFDGASAEMR